MAKRSTINQMKYDKEHRRVYGFRLHNENDKDIIEKLSSVPSMQGYIKDLIRKDIGTFVPDSVSNSNSVPKTNSMEGKTMKTYHIKPEYYDLWLGSEDMRYPETVIVTEQDIVNFAKEWEITVEELKEQLIPD